jgi:hypothetical protein
MQRRDAFPGVGNRGDFDVLSFARAGVLESPRCPVSDARVTPTGRMKVEFTNNALAAS